MWESYLNLLTDYTFQTVAIGTGFLGLLSGVIGTLATLRQESLLGDVLSHSALPGIGIAFLLLKEKNLLMMLLGAAIAGGIATVFINWMKEKSTIIKGDGAMALTLSSFFGLGLVLMTYIQKQPNGNQAGLENFIYGQASSMLLKDVYLSVGLGSVLLILLAIFWKEIKLFIFDPVFTYTLGFSAKFLNGLISLMIVVTIVIGLESVGVVLMSTLLIAPAIAARQWSNRMHVVAIIAGIFGFLSGVIGTLISSVGVKIPTGPTIVLTASFFVLLSLLFAPERGLIAKQIRHLRNTKRLINKVRELDHPEERVTTKG